MSLAEEITMLRKRIKKQNKEIRRLKEEPSAVRESDFCTWIPCIMDKPGSQAGLVRQRQALSVRGRQPAASSLRPPVQTGLDPPSEGSFPLLPPGHIPPLYKHT